MIARPTLFSMSLRFPRFLRSAEREPGPLVLIVSLLLALAPPLYGQGNGGDGGMPFMKEESDSATSLLWRIERDDLDHVSYLFGTYHSQNQRVFNFGDSVLPALRASRVAAFELAVDSMMYQFFNTTFQVDTTFDLARHITPGQFHLLTAEVQEKLGFTREWLRHASPSLLLFLLDRDYMGPATDADFDLDNGIPLFNNRETFLDAWLYRAAKLEGLQTIGLEQLSEQMSIIDTIPFEDQIRILTDPDLVAEQMADAETVSRRTLDSLYRTGNIEALYRLTAESGFFPGLSYSLLEVRNRRMAERLDPLLQNSPVFTAVGAAHLGGPEGLIRLLRQRGYRLVPVIAGHVTTGKNYSLPTGELPWERTTINDSATGTPLYHFDTPSPPVLFPSRYYTENEESKSVVRNAYDIFNSLMYSVSRFPLSPQLIDEEEIFNTIRENRFDSDERSMRPIRVETDGVIGREVMGRSSDNELQKIRLYIVNGYLYAFTVQGTQMLRSSDDLRFFRSIHFPEQSQSPWSRVSIGSGTAIELPGDLMRDTTRIWSDSINSYVTRQIVSSVDRKSGIRYQVEKIDLPLEYENESDSALVLWGLQLGLNDSALAHTQITRLGEHPRLGSPIELRLVRGERGLIRRQAAIDQNHLWMLTAVRPDRNEEKRIDTTREKSFFASLDQLPLSPPDFRAESNRHAWPLENFSIILPNPDIDSATSFSYSGDMSMTLGRRSGRENYQVTITTYSPYLQGDDQRADTGEGAVEEGGWTIDPAVRELLRASLESYRYVNDIRSEQEVSQGGTVWMDVVGLRTTYDGPPRLFHERVALHGHHLYHLSWTSSDTAADPANALPFFNSFQLLRPTPERDLFAPKGELILRDLLSTDSATRVEAMAALRYPADYTRLAPQLRRLIDELVPQVWEDQRKKEEEERELNRLTPSSSILQEYYYRLAINTYGYDSDGAAPFRAALLKRLIDQFGTMTDDSQKEYLFRLYPLLPYGSQYRASLLEALIGYRTRSSLEKARDLLLAHPDDVIDSYEITSPFLDSLTGFDIIFPALSAHRGFGWDYSFLPVVSRAIDSGMIDPRSNRAIGPFRDRLLHDLQRLYLPEGLKFTQEEPYEWEIEAKIGVAGRLPWEKNMDRLFHQLLYYDNPGVQRAAIVALLAHERNVDRDVLEGIVVDPIERLQLWDELKRIGHLDDFPADYANQSSINESIVASYLDYEEEFLPDGVEYVAERIVDVNGTKRRAYLYRGTWAWGDESGASIVFFMQPVESDSIYSYSESTGFNSRDEADLEGTTDETFEMFLQLFREYGE